MKRHGEPGPFGKFHNFEKNLFRWAIVGIVAAFVSLLVFSFSDSDDISKPIDSASESIPVPAQDAQKNEGDGDATSQTKTVIMGQKYVEDGVEKEKLLSGTQIRSSDNSFRDVRVFLSCKEALLGTVFIL